MHAIITFLRNMFKASDVLKLLYEENHVNIILTAKEMEIHKLCWTSAKS